MAAQGKSVLDAGGVIVEILAADFFQPATRNDLDAWVNTYKIPVTSVRDPDNLPNQSLMALVRREYCFVVDLKTMKIVQRFIGSTDGSGTSSAKLGMAAMLKLLGH